MKFKNDIAIPTTKFEKVMLQKLKYDLINKEADYVNNWHPEECFVCNPLILADALGYPSVSYKGSRMISDDPCYGYADLSWTPKNLDALIAGYRLAGKHRKVASILKECKRRGIEAPFMWGYQLPHYFDDEVAD
jgi:hypothetical protein